MSSSRRSRPLLSASVGVATMTLTACQGCMGNLMPPPSCTGTTVHESRYSYYCVATCPPGTQVVYDSAIGSYCDPIPDSGIDASASADDAGQDASADATADHD